jgi:hypothetical protein
MHPLFYIICGIRYILNGNSSVGNAKIYGQAIIGTICLNNITKANDVFVIFFKYIDHVFVEAYCLAIYENTFFQW